MLEYKKVFKGNQIETKNLTLLLVEDEAPILDSSYRILSTFFKEVITASNGKEGLTQYIEYKNEIDIILTDIRMPEMNGIDMIKEIRKKNSNIPIYIVSGDLEKEHDISGLNISKYYTKPIIFKQFILDVINPI